MKSATLTDAVCKIRDWLLRCGEKKCWLYDEPYEDFVVEVSEWIGSAEILQVAYYAKMNGDLVPDPELKFYLTTEAEIDHVIMITCSNSRYEYGQVIPEDFAADTAEFLDLVYDRHLAKRIPPENLPDPALLEEADEVRRHSRRRAPDKRDDGPDDDLDLE